MLGIRSLLALLLLFAPAVALADGEAPPEKEKPADPPVDPDEERKIKEGLEKLRAQGEVGRRIDELRRDLAAGGGDQWVQRAILLVELADTGDRRAVQPMAAELTHSHPHVVAFALHGLNRFAGEELKKGGGAPLVEGLIGALESKGPWNRKAAAELLVKVTGENLGSKPGKWKSWLKKHAGELVVEDVPLAFDDSKYDRAKVEKVRVQTGDKGTSVRPRIPSIGSEIRELNQKGLDIVLCLDQTSSMGAVIEETKNRIDVLVTCVREVVKDHRVGLVTYDDGVKVQVQLTPDVGRLREALQKVRAEGGGDLPEGVDKALQAALKPEFGWRSKSVRTVVVLGDAPPHEPDVEPTKALLKELRQRAGFTVHTVATHVKLNEFDQLAEAGGGRSLELGAPSQLVSEVLLLIFGEKLRPAMERFVPVLLDVVAAASEAGRR